VAAPDVIVIGGGLHGCSSALHLARRGLRVTLLEKDHVGRHASGVNAGGVRRLGRHVAEIPLSLAAMELWHGIEGLVDDDCGFESHGQVKVAESEAELEILRRRVAEFGSLGYSHEELIGVEELREILPAVSPHCRGAIICRRDGAANPYRTTFAFKRKAESLGACIEEGRLVIAEERPDGVLIRPALALPIEIYTPERKAEFLLSNAVDAEDYRVAIAEVKKMGLKPASIPHHKPRKAHP